MLTNLFKEDLYVGTLAKGFTRPWSRFSEKGAPSSKAGNGRVGTYEVKLPPLQDKATAATAA